PPEAYERLILDCLLGDGTLFTRGDEVEASWSWIDHIESAWQARPAPDFPNYAAGTWGPAAADRLIAEDGRVWRRPWAARAGARSWSSSSGAKPSRCRCRASRASWRSCGGARPRPAQVSSPRRSRAPACGTWCCAWRGTRPSPPASG